MGTLRSASTRHLLRHPLQLALAVGGLALGVATVTAVDLATASARRAFGLSLDAVQGAATHEISGGPAGVDGPIGHRPTPVVGAAQAMSLRHRCRTPGP